MIIEKDKEPGYYLAKASVKGELFIAVGESHRKAMDRCFEKIKWYLNLERE